MTRDHFEAELDRLAAEATAGDVNACRLVYADWLDEGGDAAEATRQRRLAALGKVPAAPAWITNFCWGWYGNQLDRNQHVPDAIPWRALIVLRGTANLAVSPNAARCYYTRREAEDALLAAVDLCAARPI